MTMTRTHYVFAALIVAQLLCAIFYLSDVISDLSGWGPLGGETVHMWMEVVAGLGLFVAIGIEVKYFSELLQNKARLEKSVALASSSMQVIIESHFSEWKLTPAEQDIATFLVKGLSIQEIAKARSTAEGTIKAHLNAIYRKSGARNRAEVMSILFESLMDGPLITTQREASTAAAA